MDPFPEDETTSKGNSKPSTKNDEKGTSSTSQSEQPHSGLPYPSEPLQLLNTATPPQPSTPTQFVSTDAIAPSLSQASSYIPTPPHAPTPPYAPTPPRAMSREILNASSMPRVSTPTKQNVSVFSNPQNTADKPSSPFIDSANNDITKTKMTMNSTTQNNNSKKMNESNPLDVNKAQGQVQSKTSKPIMATRFLEEEEEKGFQTIQTSHEAISASPLKNQDDMAYLKKQQTPLKSNGNVASVTHLPSSQYSLKSTPTKQDAEFKKSDGESLKKDHKNRVNDRPVGSSMNSLNNKSRGGGILGSIQSLKAAPSLLSNKVKSEYLTSNPVLFNKGKSSQNNSNLQSHGSLAVPSASNMSRSGNGRLKGSRDNFSGNSSSRMKLSSNMVLNVASSREVLNMGETLMSSIAQLNAEKKSTVNSSMMLPNFGSFMKLNRGPGSKAEKDINYEHILIHENLSDKDTYTEIGFLIGVILAIICCLELAFLITSGTVIITAYWIIPLQIFQCFGFYLFMLGFIFANEEGDVNKLKRSLVAFGVNMISFVLRIVLVYMFGGYVPAEIGNI